MRRNKLVSIFIIIILIIVMAYTAIISTTESTHISPYSSGEEADYIVQYSNSIEDHHPISKFGNIEFVVNKDNISLRVNAPGFYSANKSLVKELSLQRDGTYFKYHNKKIILPFFCSGRSVISYYNGNYANLSGSQKVTNTLQGGLIRYQSVTYLYSNDSILLYGPGTPYRENNIPISYEYGSGSKLLFFLNGAIGPDPVVSYLLGFNTTTKSPNGTICVGPVQASLSLHSTNINLGRVNFALLILTLMVVALPFEIPVVIVFLGVYIYGKWKNKKN